MRPMWALAMLLLAGCSEPAEPTAPTASTVIGWVADASLRPITGAEIRVEPTGLNTSTDAEGRFLFASFHADELVTIVVSADGYETAARTVRHEVYGQQLVTNFTLQAIPGETPWREINEFQGFFNCGVIAQAGHDHGQNPHNHNWVDCGEATNQHVWLMPVKPGLTGAVFEVFWEASNPTAENLVVFVEGVANAEETFFSFYEGQTGMKGTVSRLQALTFFGDSHGTLRFTILPGAPEQDVALATHINQEYEVIATLFYGETPAADYSIASP